MKNNKHWIIVFVSSLMMAASIGISLNTSGVFYSPVANDLNILRGTFSFHMTLFTLVTGLGAFIIPTLIKKVPLKLIFTFSAITCALSTGVMGLFSNIPMFYLLGIIRGLSASMFGVVPISMIINNWFYEKRGLALSIVLSASGLAGAVGSYVLGNVVSQYGWRVGYFVSGIIILALNLPAILYPFKFNPLDENIRPYGLIKDIKYSNEDKKVKEKFNFITITFLSLVLAVVLVSFTSSIAQHFPGYAETINFAKTGAVMVSAGMVGNILFKVIIGILSDKIGAFKSSIIMICVTITGLCIILFSRHSLLLILGAFVFGACFSVGAVASSLLTVEFFGLKKYDIVYPVINFVTNVGAAISLSAIGFIYDIFNSYQIAIVICITMLTVAMVSLFIGQKNR